MCNQSIIWILLSSLEDEGGLFIKRLLLELIPHNPTNSKLGNIQHIHVMPSIHMKYRPFFYSSLVLPSMHDVMHQKHWRKKTAAWWGRNGNGWEWVAEGERSQCAMHGRMRTRGRNRKGWEWVGEGERDLNVRCMGRWERDRDKVTGSEKGDCGVGFNHWWINWMVRLLLQNAGNCTCLKAPEDLNRFFDHDGLLSLTFNHGG